ncbi:MAG: hypothetical protein JPMHGGIA_01966 [Saprospiraceae bacterium]|nr:hypothetical protein [Saprospiraceae bacterium]
MKHFYLIPLLLFCFLTADAQYYVLPFVGAGSNPGGLNKDNEYPPGGGLPAGWATVLSGAKPTRTWSAVQNIPFPFQFNGTDVTQYKAASSGVVTFSVGDTTTVDYDNEALPSAKIPDQSVLVWGLVCNANDFIVSKTFGTAPNRQHWISYNSYSEPNLKSGWIYISVVLEESTNNIYIVDQRTQCVFNGQVCQDKTALTLGLQIDKTTAVEIPGSPNYKSTNTNMFIPDDNSYFQFIPGIQPAADVLGRKHILARYYLTRDFPIPLTGKFMNSGSGNITDVEYGFNIDDGALGSFSGTVSNLNAAPLENFDVLHPDPIVVPGAGTYRIKSWMNKINGNDPPSSLDDTIRSVIIVNDSAVTRKLLHENFSSSTCPPCKPGNERLHSVVGQYPGLYSELTYHFYFPTPGDPYYTSECADRSNYYNGINSIPATLLDGQININPNGYLESTFEEWQRIPSFYTVNPSGKVDGNKVSITVDVSALLPTKATTRLIVAVAEKLTVKNVKNNGETEFPHVMKKMVPNASGTLTGIIQAGATKTFNLSWTIPGSYRLPLDAQAANIINLATEHSIEEFDDLEVFAWLQESDKSVLQSNSADLEFVVANSNPVANKQLVAYPTQTSDYFFLDMSAFSSTEPLRVLIADETGQIRHAEKTSLRSLFVNTSQWASGVYYAKVIGQNEEGLQKVVVIH